jgi:hypothetical protein
MVREQRVGGLSTASTMGDHTHNQTKNSDGKRLLVEALPEHDAARRGATGEDRELDDLRSDVKSAYLGLGGFAERGILDNKIQGVYNMTAYLSGPDTSPVGSSFLGSALSIGAEVAASALAAATEGAPEALVVALAAGTRLVASTFHSDSIRRSLLDPVRFTSKYYIALTNRWPDSVHSLLHHMTALPEARRIRDHVCRMCDQPAKIIANQQNEILDAWVNALKAQTQGGNIDGMGDDSFEKPVAGRLHIHGVKLHTGGGGRPVLDIGDLSADLVDVADGARALLLSRELKNIRIARTIEGSIPIELPQRNPPLRKFAFGVLFDGKIAEQSETDPVAKAALTSFGKGDFHHGFSNIWEVIGSSTLEKLRVTKIGG